MLLTLLQSAGEPVIAPVVSLGNDPVGGAGVAFAPRRKPQKKWFHAVLDARDLEDIMAFLDSLQ